MEDPIKQANIYDNNAIYYGYPMGKLMENAGKGVANFLLRKFGKNKKIGFFCGLGNNGGDGFVAARHLLKSSQPVIYLTGKAKDIKTSEAKQNWKKFKGEKIEQIQASDIPDDFDVVVECLFGTGIKGELKQKYKLIVEKLNQLKGKKVAIDFPAPGFKSDFVISMMVKKTKNAHLVDINYPQNLKQKIGVGEVKALYKPPKSSHKGDNGNLLIIGGSKKYHGAPVLAAKIASKIVDLVYFSSIPENNKIIQKMKSKLCEFITLSPDEAFRFVKNMDAVLMGPGLEPNKQMKVLVNKLIEKNKHKKFILDAGALKIVNKKLLNKNCLVTPHKQEFKALFKKTASKKAVLEMAEKYNCVVVLKGAQDLVSNGKEVKVNTTGNPGMTKGGTGDILAGLIAGLSSKNDLFLAAQAGVFINGLAGDRLNKKSSYYFNASDLIEEIPKTIKYCEDF